MLRRIFLILTVPLAAVITLAAPALAQNAHLKGSHPLSFTDNGLTLTGTASYAGLGNFDTVQTLTATGQPTATCTNPSGVNKPPGHNPAQVTLTGATAFPASAIKNGNVTITTTTKPPVTPIPGAPDCPGSSWTENITDVAFTSATITLSQQGATVITVNVTFSPPTSNGPVPGSGFTFTTSP